MTDLPKGECAIVSTDNMTSLELLLPDEPDGEKIIPPTLAFMMACVLRYTHDPDFVADQLAWLRTQVEQRKIKSQMN
jgi:hypothetical protein